MTETAKPPKKKRLKTILIATVAVLLVGGGSAGAAVYFTGGLRPAGAEAEDEHHPKLVARDDADEAAVARATAAAEQGRPDPELFKVSYIPIEENFTSNLAGGTAFVQIGLSLSTYYDEQVPANVEHHMLAIRSAVLVTLAEQDAQALTTTAGKHALRVTLTRAINAVLREREGFGGIDDVQFTAFVMQ
jgi:flagellar protein FliL